MNKKAISFCLSILMIIQISVLSPMITYCAYTDNLIGNWNMELTGTEIKDSSANGLNLSTAYASVGEGVVGNCSIFTGEGKAACSNNALFNHQEQLSISMWVNQDKLVGDHLIIDKNEIFRINIDKNGRIAFILKTDNNPWYGSAVLTSEKNVIKADLWYHIVGVYDSNSMKLYLNGKKVAEKQGVSGKLGNLGESFYISKVPTAGQNVTRHIDEVKLGNIAFSDEEINELYKEGIPEEPLPPEEEIENLVANWKSIENGMLIDKNGNDGQIDGDVTQSIGLADKAAFDFKNGNVEIADNEKLDDMPQLTLSTWIKLKELPKNDGFVPLGKDSSDGSYRLRIHNDGKISFAIATQNNAWYTDGTVIATKEKIAPDNWYHIGSVYDGNNIYIYVNGELWARSSNIITGNIKNTDSNLYLSSQSCNEKFKGVLQNPMIIARGLTKEEMQKQYNNISEFLVDIDFENVNGTEFFDKKNNPVKILGNPEIIEENSKKIISLDGDGDALEVNVGNVLDDISTMSINAKVRFNTLESGKNYGFISKDEGGKASFHSTIEKSMFNFAVKSDNIWYSGKFKRISSPKLPKTGEWADVTLNYNKGNLSYYINGVLCDSVFTGNGGGIDKSPTKLHIGKKDATFLPADFSRITVSKDIIAAPKTDAQIGNEEILKHLKKELSYIGISKLYIPKDKQFTYILSLNVDGKEADCNLFSPKLENQTPGVEISDSNLIIDSTVAQGDLFVNFTYKNDNTITKQVKFNLEKFEEPVVKNIVINGSTSVNSNLKVEFENEISQDLPQKSIKYMWLKSSSENGTYSQILDGNTSSYTTKNDDENCYIKAGIEISSVLEDYVLEEVPVLTVYSSPKYIESEEDDSNTITNSGGGGSGGNKPSIPIIKPENTDKNEKKELAEFVVPFNDIIGHWAFKDISDLCEKGIVTGVLENKFEPDKPITRAQIATIIVRGFELSQKENIQFKDVSKDDWFFESVNIISASKIMQGNNNEFNPNEYMTREELAKITENILKFKGCDGKGKYNINLFDDYELIGEWAKKSVEISCAEGIMQGISSKEFAPKTFVTRAESSVIIKRLLNKLEV